MSRLVLVLLLLAAVSGLHAQDDDPVSTVSVRLASRRVFRGVVESGPGTAGTLEFTRSGWRIGAGFAQPFDGDEPGKGTLDAAYAWRATKQLKLAVLATQQWHFDVPTGATKHSFEVGFSATWSAPSGFAVELAGFHDLRLKADTVQATLSYSMPLKSIGAYLEWSASAGASSARDLLPDAAGGPVRDGFSYYTGSVRLPYRIGTQTVLVAGAHVAETDGQSRSWSPIATRGGFHGWVDLSLSFDF